MSQHNTISRSKYNPSELMFSNYNSPIFTPLTHSIDNTNTTPSNTTLSNTTLSNTITTLSNTSQLVISNIIPADNTKSIVHDTVEFVIYDMNNTLSIIANTESIDNNLSVIADTESIDGTRSISIDEIQGVTSKNTDIISRSCARLNMVIGNDKITDICIAFDIVYGLMRSVDGYYIVVMNKKSKEHIVKLGKFSHSLYGFIRIYNGSIVIIIYHEGAFELMGNRFGSSIGGIVICMNINSYKILSFRKISLDKDFLIVGGLQTSLYLITNNQLHKFNPNESSSWVKPLTTGIISSCIISNYIIILRCDSLEILDQNTGISKNIIIFSSNISPNSCICASNLSEIYIVTLDNNILTVSYVDNSSTKSLFDCRINKVVNHVLSYMIDSKIYINIGDCLLSLSIHYEK